MMLTSGYELPFLFNLLFSLLAGLIIGAERESREKPAGIATHSLVIGGSMMFAFLSSLIDPSARIAAAIISGIGFLGAGVIIKGEHGTITNLTTAASVWFGCSIGIAIGYGLYFMALIGIIFAAAVPRIPSVSKEHSPFRKNGKGKKSAL
ncbi:MgtC/SapB family protein [Candidatus Woesearchaeota archaeon]|nr:MgtC/SapB family protein [Candidatus Woesearchaeota archaeon]HIH37672.1 MgtC/SapB family protein [Candidatus Woesearchaeota archaeon]HIH49078.1 MgtC/SapB family protein [Candidatus Woesearchaeota archaeon]HIJ02929.1 MgtC/SapB family protein [Candidatus Woesearchaeota archaeon]